MRVMDARLVVRALRSLIRRSDCKACVACAMHIQSPMFGDDEDEKLFDDDDGMVVEFVGLANRSISSLNARG